MQKPVEGLSVASQKAIEDRTRIGAFHNQKHVEKPSYIFRGISIKDALHASLNLFALNDYDVVFKSINILF
jgi:hypothetical protein